MRTKDVTGWVDTAGRFYKCRYQEHWKWAKKHGTTERYLETQGWVKFDTVDERFMVDRDIPRSRFTQKQLDTCFDLAVKYEMLDEFEVFKFLYFD